MLKKIIRMLVQILFVFIILVGFAKLVNWSMVENSRIEIEKANEHINKINESKASRGVL